MEVILESDDEPQQAFLTYTEKSKAERTGILQLRKKLMQQQVRCWAFACSKLK